MLCPWGLTVCVCLGLENNAADHAELNQSRLSKMCWLELWISLRSQGFSEAVIASCMFQSIHRKEFRFLCYLLDTVAMDTRCCGGHSHVKVQGSLTQASAVHTDALAVALAFKRSLDSLDASERLSPVVDGLESVRQMMS